MINSIHSDTDSRFNWGWFWLILLYIIISLGVMYMVFCKVTGSFQPWLMLTPDNLLGVFFVALQIFGIVGLFFLLFAAAL